MPDVMYIDLDERDREEQRYALYAAALDAYGKPGHDEPGDRNLRELMATASLDGVGQMIALCIEDGLITPHTRVGLLDKVARTWLINPYAKGAL